MSQDLYRLNVGLCVLNKNGQVFTAERAEFPNSWQMPQGGIDEGEDIEAAALRELFEETHISSVTILKKMAEPLRYDLPEATQKKLWNGKYKGQEQHWFCLEFFGDESEIDIFAHSPPEFINWRWAEIQTLPELIVPFKRAVYERVLEEFLPCTLTLRD